MTYREARVARDLAFCAFALFAVRCLVEVWSAALTGDRMALGQDIVLQTYYLPTMERLLLRLSSEGLRAMALVHGVSAFAILLAFGVLTWRFAKRPGVIEATILAGCIAFLPVSTVAESVTRAVVNMHQRPGTYEQATSDGRDARPKESRWFMGAVSTLSRVSFPDSMANALDGATLRDVSASVVDAAWERASTIRSIATTVFDVVATLVCGLLFGWTTSRFLARRRRLAGQGSAES